MPERRRTPGKGHSGAFCGRCCGGEARRDDSPTPCKIDLGGGTRYHKNMKKREKTQENKGEATKSAPGKRTAPKARKATKGTTGTEASAPKTDAVNAAKPKKAGKTGREMRKETNAKIAAKAESILKNTLKSAPLFDELHSIPHESVEEWIEGTRKCLKSDAFDGMRAVFYFTFNKGRTPALKLRPGSPILESASSKKPLEILKEQFQHPEKVDARWERHSKKEKDDILSDLMKCAEKQKEAEGTYRGKEGIDLDGLCRYLNKNRDWLKKDKRPSIRIYVTKKKETDFVAIPWSLPVNDKKYATMNFRYSRRDERAIQNLKEALRKNHIMTITSMSAFIVDAVIQTMTLMVRYGKPAEFIFNSANRKLMEMAVYEQFFTNEEVRELVNTEDIDERRAKHEKLIARKAALNEQLFSDFRMELLERSGRLDLS